MPKVIWLVALVALDGCGPQATAPALANRARPAVDTGPFPADRLLRYRVTATSTAGGDADPEASASVEVACKQRTERVEPWLVSTIECDPAAGMFNARKAIEITYATDGTRWWSRRGRLTGDDAARWTGRGLTGDERASLFAEIGRDAIAGPPPWTATGDDGCDHATLMTPNVGGDEAEGGSDTTWCPLEGGGARRVAATWSSEEGYYQGSDLVELTATAPLP